MSCNVVLWYTRLVPPLSSLISGVDEGSELEVDGRIEVEVEGGPDFDVEIILHTPQDGLGQTAVTEIHGVRVGVGQTTVTEAVQLGQGRGHGAVLPF